MIKKTFLIISSLIILAFIGLSIKGNEMKTITTEITISAPPEKVWQILIDINNWKTWSPIIIESSGIANVGSKLNITMIGKEEGSNGPNYKPVITILEKEKILSLRAKMLGGLLMTNGKILELEKTQTGTRLIHKETFSGLMSAMIWNHMEKGVPPMLNAMNNALKAKAEK